jgi:hypothetical protein
MTKFALHVLSAFLLVGADFETKAAATPTADDTNPRFDSVLPDLACLTSQALDQE